MARKAGQIIAREPQPPGGHFRNAMAGLIY